MENTKYTPFHNTLGLIKSLPIVNNTQNKTHNNTISLSLFPKFSLSLTLTLVVSRINTQADTQ